MSNGVKRRDGFIGEKLINVPPKVLEEVKKNEPELFPVYITQIGYFPKASFHYRERRRGCSDNILIYCLQGKGHYILDDKRYEVNSNQFIIIPATDKYMRYWADKDDPWTIYWVHYTGDGIDAFNRALHLSIANGPVLIPFNEKALEIWQYIYQTLEMGYSTENLCNASFCLYHLIATFLFPQKHMQTSRVDDGDIIAKTINSMRDNINKKLTVEAMAASHSLSVSHFSTLFRKATGMPPIDYFIHIKMQKACQLLYNNVSKIRDVATDLGYDDPYYFSRIFKKYIGSSPEQYRLNIKSSA
ncbi:AraC family transcriptional regulator [Mucilaginibacter dorajii]|uniref:AraC family transcriptional regulator n=1 Tax=Mucilaginibacter dorajii TaxID=692994 RepID=A0ABP7R976_9SPHI|nr:AraC family transcriptional regulator [Mucilaginibacter dorajii]MCS3737312.1 AraC-like DNA-binding protein [Mucilaginibacter dorajii]